MTVSSMIGVAFGGWMYMRWGTFKSLLVFGVGQALTNLMYVWLALTGKEMWLMILGHGPWTRASVAWVGGLRRVLVSPVQLQFQRHPIRVAVGHREPAADQHGAIAGQSWSTGSAGQISYRDVLDRDAGAGLAGDIATAGSTN